MHLVIRSVSKTAGISTLAKRNSNKKGWYYCNLFFLSPA